ARRLIRGGSGFYRLRFRLSNPLLCVFQPRCLVVQVVKVAQQIFHYVQRTLHTFASVRGRALPRYHSTGSHLSPPPNTSYKLFRTAAPVKTLIKKFVLLARFLKIFLCALCVLCGCMGLVVARQAVLLSFEIL